MRRLNFVCISIRTSFVIINVLFINHISVHNTYKPMYNYNHTLVYLLVKLATLYFDKAFNVMKKECTTGKKIAIFTITYTLCNHFT